MKFARRLLFFAVKKCDDLGIFLKKPDIHTSGPVGTSQVDHPNCIKLHAIFETEKRVFIVTELVSGGELLDRSCTSSRTNLLSQLRQKRVTGMHICLCDCCCID